MSLKPLTEERISFLRSNPNAKKVPPKSIQFAERFKLELMRRYDGRKNRYQFSPIAASTSNRSARSASKGHTLTGSIRDA